MPRNPRASDQDPTWSPASPAFPRQLFSWPTTGSDRSHPRGRAPQPAGRGSPSPGCLGFRLRFRSLLEFELGLSWCDFGIKLLQACWDLGLGFLSSHGLVALRILGIPFRADAKILHGQNDLSGFVAFRDRLVGVSNL